MSFKCTPRKNGIELWNNMVC